MSLQSDATISLKKEASYSTEVTPDVSYEFIDEDLQYLPEYTQGVGTRYGSRMGARDVNVLTKESVGGSFTTEGKTKGLGKLFEAALGTGASTSIDGTAYQQVFTPVADDFLPSYTIQKGIPMLGGSMAPMTLDGMQCAGFEMSADNGGIPKIKWNWIGKQLVTATAFATPAYPAGTRLFSFVDGSIVSGAITPPTTTALTSGGTALANIRSFDFDFDNGLDTEGFNFGASGRRARPAAVDQRKATGTLVAEYDSNTLRDAWIAQTDLALLLRFKTKVAISTGNYPTLEICMPVVLLRGELPKAVRAGGGVHTQSIPFEVFDGRVATHPLYVAIVTAETAI